MIDRTPTTKQVKRVYVLAPDNLARDGKQDWSMRADGQFDRWLAAHDDEVRVAAMLEAANIAAEVIPHPWFRDATYIRTGGEAAEEIRRRAKEKN